MSKAAAVKTEIEKERPKALRIQAELFDGGQSLGSFVTEDHDKLIIGSSKRADLVVPHETVSQIHAMLRIVNDEDVVLYDLGSEKGTFVSGKKIVEHKLVQGEFFEIGSHRVKVNLLNIDLGETGSESAMFWQAQCGGQPDFLEAIIIQSDIVQEERTLAKNGYIAFGRRKSEVIFDGVKAGSKFVQRKDSGGATAECFLPNGFKAEIFDANNDLVRVVEQDNALFTFNANEKVRLFNSTETQIFLFWRQQGIRAKRYAPDAENQTLQRAYLICFTLAAIALAFLSYVPLKKEVIEEAATPKSSYFRMSMESAPGPKSEDNEQPAAAASESQAQNQAPASKAASISSSLSKLLNKKSSVSAESINQAISANGSQTVRANVQNSGMKSQDIASGQIGSGGNVNAISAGLASGGGAKAGSLNGFASGKGASIGGGGGFGGKGFSMNLGGDEAEAIGGLDKSLIAAVVQANIGQIKHCYERQLIVDPNIFGKVVAQWTINKDGLVSATSVKKSTMNNAPVENCILGKIKTWEFPKPKGGGQVIVSYPFLFKSLN